MKTNLIILAYLIFRIVSIGHPNIEEDNVQAAIREVHEEVGIPLQLSSLTNSRGEFTFADNCYTFVDFLHKDAWKRHPNYPDSSKRPICVTYKTVRIYLAFSEQTELKLQEEEVSDAEWLSTEAALSRFTFEDDGIIARQLLKSPFMQEKIKS